MLKFDHPAVEIKALSVKKAQFGLQEKMLVLLVDGRVRGHLPPWNFSPMTLPLSH